MELTDKEMYQVNGGVSWQIISVIGGIFVYLIGVIEGYTNPNKCNN